MKEVKFIKTNTIDLDDLNANMFVGVKFQSGNRGMVMKIKRREYCVYNIVEPINYSEKIIGNSIQDLIKNLLSASKVVVLEDKEEVIEWLSGKLD